MDDQEKLKEFQQFFDYCKKNDLKPSDGAAVTHFVNTVLIPAGKQKNKDGR